MFEWAFLIFSAVVLCFGFVLLFGAPYVPVLTPQMKTALDIIDLQPGQTLLELGCGDGKVLIAAAERGIHAVGYELNPIMAAIAWLRTRRYRRQVKVIWGNFWHQQWPPADGIFVFLLDKFMPRLDRRLRQWRRPIKVVSFAFQIPDRSPTTTRGSVYLYCYEPELAPQP